MVIQRLLIANRGEIARRIIRTCRKLGIASIAVYSTADRNAPFVREADEAYHLNGESSASSHTYLDMSMLVEIAKRASADAIHPGYGFLSENADFAALVAKSGLIFVGPSAEAIRIMGSKAEAKRVLANDPDVPLIPGYSGEDQSLETLLAKGKEMGYPLLIKAAAGGGGKGMRVVRSGENLAAEIEGAKREAQSYFGDDRVILERFFDKVRHIEVQIFGDNHGNVVHIFERECSLQRRYQKVVEESPSIAMTQSARERMFRAAIKIGQRINYSGAGTVEFILDDTQNFYFLEVNTRLQVEHPVTEETTQLDLVEAQIRVAEGASLVDDLQFDRLTQQGHAIEVRIYAEDPANEFFPCSGKILHWAPALDIEGLRYDSGIETGSEISIFYDPMVAKVIARGKDRREATMRLVAALRRTVIAGLRTNVGFLLEILTHSTFPAADFHTNFIKEALADGTLRTSPPAAVPDTAAIGCFLWYWHQRHEGRTLLRNVRTAFRNNPYSLQSDNIEAGGQQYKVAYEYLQHNSEVVENGAPGVANLVRGDGSSGPRNKVFSFRIIWAKVATDGKEAEEPKTEVFTTLLQSGEGALCFELNGAVKSFTVVEDPAVNVQRLFLHNLNDGTVECARHQRLLPSSGLADPKAELGYTAPMHSKILKVLVKSGDSVEKGQALLVVESMKMENRIKASSSGTAKVLVKEGEMVEAGTKLVIVE
eukprot:CAMPEP_0119135230 /NCGR_PEP_ID=MMETSP1310-20130426/18910_1 /TAXON_ID=464262 /ORGANISM="Genus nov. species nov., Strain RCC2339" /LENGTH=709 /DNA_ID=CAMNT_0007126095 /DNA_START=45 /DNA_END=2174 /DNA_ORIENTATION=-